METSAGSLEPSLLLLDACCAINLLASGRAHEIIASLQTEVGVARLVLEDEVLRVGGASSEEEPTDEYGRRPAPSASEDVLDRSTDEPSAITFHPLVDRNLIRVLDLVGDEEKATFVNLALQLDDGEAMTGALALHRRTVVATDDRKAIRVLTGRTPPVPIRRTSQLLKEWSQAADVTAEDLRGALKNIENRASFLPPKDDPLYAWWRGASSFGDEGGG